MAGLSCIVKTKRGYTRHKVKWFRRNGGWASWCGKLYPKGESAIAGGKEKRCKRCFAAK